MRPSALEIVAGDFALAAVVAVSPSAGALNSAAAFRSRRLGADLS
jgi:hypothetical protein